MTSIKTLGTAVISEVAGHITNGNLCVLPTDTLYALSADATSDEAVERLYVAKKRQISNSLPVFVTDIEHAKQFVEFNDVALELAQKYWPGALTIVLPVKQDANISHLVHQNKPSLAVRVPDSDFIIQVIKKAGRPITGTSANISSMPNTFDVKQIARDFADFVEVVVEDPELHKKDLRPSTIVDCTGPKPVIIRMGKLELTF